LKKKREQEDRKIRKGGLGLRTLVLLVGIVLFSVPARAQVRFDVGALGTFQQRFLSGVPAGGSGLAEGGGLTLDGHVALFPLLRLGGWVTGEASKPLDQSPLREIFGGGLRVKVVPPWPRGTWRMWIATGFGYDGLVSDVGGGGFFEIPAILGASYRIRRPWVFLMELGARAAFGFWGSYYDRAGTDVLSIALSIGFGIDG
jgi:hypothetical protein